ncbi:NUDIX hydrolase [Microbacterium sp. YY-03]|uniref:NUDIX hydrolase n=1 Tax=Microbacterium sp. YY-03 TaxID=3421636 RepID=UPI003D16CD58
MTSDIIRVSAVLITDTAGRALMVRKHGTAAFMQPGGKPEAGETPAQTAARELAEELGIIVDPGELAPLGTHRTAAANEHGFDVVADCFALTIADPTGIAAAAEIAEARWLTLQDLATLTIAPLSMKALLPLVWGEAPVSAALLARD